MTSMLIDFAAMRPEYSRLERYHELAELYLELGRPDRAILPLEKYLRWNPEDSKAKAILKALVEVKGS